MLKTRTLTAGALIAALALGGCGGSSSKKKASQAVNPNTAENSPAGDIPDNQAYVVYATPNAGYSVKVPEGWARTATGAATTFTDKLNSVRLESAKASGPLTVASAKRIEVPRIGLTAKGFRLTGVTSVKRGAGNAIRIKYLAAAKPDPVTGKAGTDAVERYVFFDKGRRAILTLSGPKAADNVDPWKLISSSVRWR